MLSLKHYGSSRSKRKDITKQLEEQNSNNSFKLHKSPSEHDSPAIFSVLQNKQFAFSLKQHINGPLFSPSIGITVAFDLKAA